MNMIDNFIENFQHYNKICFSLHEIYTGVYLHFFTFNDNEMTFQHDSFKDLIAIEYCYNGRLGWSTENGHSVYLGPGDFAIHILNNCTCSKFELPNNHYEGMTIYLDFNLVKATTESLQLLDKDIISKLQYKLSQSNNFISFAGNEESETIFKYFFNQPENLKNTYWKIKIIELFLYLEKIDYHTKNQLTEYQSEQIRIIRSIHEELINNLNQRITIESLAKKYLINTTTLKETFKDVYGEPIATHIKNHRISIAIQLLQKTDKTIAEIAKELGYESQSKFAQVFKNHTQLSPSEFRNYHKNKDHNSVIKND